MKRRPLSELVLYRYRYILGYSLLAILTILLLVLNVHSLPPGLSAGEKASVLQSNSIDLNFHLETISQDALRFLQTTNTIDLPYHLLQKASLTFFGLSPLGVRLPSILIAGITAFLLFILFRRLLLPSVAGVVGLLVVTSSWFMSIGHVGTPDIMIIFWAALIFLLATLVSQESRYFHAWKALGILAIGLSLYTPYTIYFYIAIAVAAFTQPHLRYVLRYTGKASLSLGILLSLVILAPLGAHVWRDPAILLQLVAVANLPDPIAFLKDFLIAVSHLLNPFNAGFAQSPLPLISIPTASFAIIGLIQLIREWHSVRSHVLLVWAAILVPLIGLDTAHNLVVLFVPVMLCCAIGVQALFKYWYTLFPRNPYARVFGVLPLGLLLLTILQFNYQRYFLGVPFAASTTSLYDQDAFILDKALSSKARRDQRIILIAPADQIPLYSIAKNTVKNLTVTSQADFRASTSTTHVVVAEGEANKLTPGQSSLLPAGKKELLVNDRKENGLRFRIYSTP